MIVIIITVITNILKIDSITFTIQKMSPLYKNEEYLIHYDYFHQNFQKTSCSHQVLQI